MKTLKELRKYLKEEKVLSGEDADYFMSAEIYPTREEAVDGYVKHELDEGNITEDEVVETKEDALCIIRTAYATISRYYKVLTGEEIEDYEWWWGNDNKDMTFYIVGWRLSF
jgi:ATP-dependent phosphoenolpyruvate carboxykinase